MIQLNMMDPKFDASLHSLNLSLFLNINFECGYLLELFERIMRKCRRVLLSSAITHTTLNVQDGENINSVSFRIRTQFIWIVNHLPD